MHQSLRQGSTVETLGTNLALQKSLHVQITCGEMLGTNRVDIQSGGSTVALPALSDGEVPQQESQRRTQTQVRQTVQESSR